MKKHIFYSMVRKEGKVIAEMQEGYTDGIYNYYRGKYKTWWCIDPQTGYAIARGNTKRSAEQSGKEVTERLEKHKSTDAYKKIVEQFNKLRCAVSIEEL